MGWPASSPEAAELEQWCIICGFWSPDYTKVKNHICQARQRDGDAAMKLCQGYSAQALKGHACPFCHRHDYDKRKHPGQCVVLFQLCFHRRHVHGTAASREPCPTAGPATPSLHGFSTGHHRRVTPLPHHKLPRHQTEGRRRALRRAEEGPAARLRTMLNPGNTC